MISSALKFSRAFRRGIAPLFLHLVCLRRFESAVLRGPILSTRVAVTVTYAACANICVPERAILSLDLPAGESAISREAGAIANAREGVPGSLEKSKIQIVHDALESASAHQRLLITLRSSDEAFRKPDLFVEDANATLLPAPSITLADHGQTVLFVVSLPSGAHPIPPYRFTFVDGERAAEFRNPVDASTPDHHQQ